MILRSKQKSAMVLRSKQKSAMVLRSKQKSAIILCGGEIVAFFYASKTGSEFISWRATDSALCFAP